MGQVDRVFRDQCRASILDRRLYSFRLSLDFIVPKLSDEDGKRALRDVFFAVLETWADGSGEIFPVGAERKRRDRRCQLWIDADPSLCYCIPDGNHTIPTSGCEGAVNRVEGNGVDRVHHVYIVHGLSMAFEGIFACLGLAGGVEPFDSHTAFDAGRSIALVVGHAIDCSRHELQTALASLPWLDIESVVGSVAQALAFACQGLEFVDVQGSRGHGNDQLGGRHGQGEGLRR